MSKIPMFICSSHLDDVEANTLRRILTDCYGHNVYYFKYSNTPGDDFYKEVMTALEHCEFFIPIISEHTKTSSFSNQEIGYAKKADKSVFAVPIDGTQPYGMLDHTESVECGTSDQKDILKAATKIALLLLTNDKFQAYWDRAAESLANALLSSASFTTTSGSVFVIGQAAGSIKFNSEHLKIIEQATKENVYVKESTKYLPVLKYSLKKYYEVELN